MLPILLQYTIDIFGHKNIIGKLLKCITHRHTGYLNGKQSSYYLLFIISKKNTYISHNTLAKQITIWH